MPPIAAVQDSDTGFSLVETLVALAIVGLLMAFLYQGLFFGSAYLGAGIRASQTASQQSELLGVAMGSLASAYPAIVKSDTTAYQVDFHGHGEALSFLTIHPFAEMPAGLRRITITRSDAGTKVSIMPLRLEEQETPAALQRFFDDLQLSFEFAAASQLRTPEGIEWVNGWKDKRQLPVAIRLHLFDAATNRDFVYIVRPQIAVDVDCAFNTLTKRCRGR